MPVQELVSWGIQTIGLEGVSTVALVSLLSVGLYVHKIASVGGMAVTVGSTAAHDLKVVVLVLTLLLVAGVISADPARLQELIQMAGRRLPGVLDWVLQRV